MSKETVDVMVEGGKATAGQALGGSLGPLGVNISEVLSKINEKTSSFKGMKVPVKVTVDTETKSFEIEIGTPPVSELIKKEVNIQKGSGTPHIDKVANLAMEQVIKIAKMKQDSMLVNDLKSAIKSVIGSCNSLGILVEGKESKEIDEDIHNGVYDKIIKEGKTEINEEKKEKLKIELEEIVKQMQKERKKLKKEEPQKEEAEEVEEGGEEKVKKEEKKPKETKK